MSLAAVQAFCHNGGLRIPDGHETRACAERLERSERPERAERSTPAADAALAWQALEMLTRQYLAQILVRQRDSIETFVREELGHLVDRVVDQVVARLAARFASAASTQAARSERAEPPERSTPALATAKAAVLTRLRAMQAEGLSLQAMANQLNAEGMPTLSGKGHWQKGTIGKLLQVGRID